MMPHAELKVFEEVWHFDHWSDQSEQTLMSQALLILRKDMFRKTGKELEKKFSRDDFLRIPRAWRLYPPIRSNNFEGTKQKLLDAGVRKG